MKPTKHIYTKLIHASPVSKGATALVKESLEFYKDNGYDAHPYGKRWSSYNPGASLP